jgi:hypothetical protein
MRANARAILIEALRDAHRWLDELLSDPRLTSESIASREDKSERSIRMTLSLAFLAPEIVKAAVEGRLPRGFGLKRLVDLPMAWSDQWRALGLQAPTQASRTIYLCSFVFRRRADPSHPNRLKVSRFETGATSRWLDIETTTGRRYDYAGVNRESFASRQPIIDPPRHHRLE